MSKAPAINIGIDEEDRAAIAQGLSRLLADTYTLYLTTHNFHWNVTGPMFNTLHAMFMEQYTELWNAVDPVAERIRALGHYSPGSYADFGRLASVPDAPAQPPKAMEMVLTGRMMGAEEAERAGLVSRIVPAADLIEDAVKTATTIAGMAPLAVKANKEMVDAAFETGLSMGVQFERRLFNGLFGTEDQREGMTAFVEKRAGVWSGK